MSQIQVKDIINVLNQLKNPATINEIVDYVHPNSQDSKTKLNEIVKTTLEAGVEFGFVKKDDDGKYQATNLNNRDNNSDTQDTIADKADICETDSQQDDNAKVPAKSIKNKTKRVVAKNKYNMPEKHNYEYSSSEEDAGDYINTQQEESDCCGRRGLCRSRSRSRRRSGRSKCSSSRRRRSTRRRRR